MQSFAVIGLLVVTAIAAPTQHLTRKVQACNAAANCETYIHPQTNRTEVRFKEGMGPDSDWYHQNVRLMDPHHPLTHAKRALLRRDDTHYNSDRSTDTEDYGNYNPVDVVNTMYDNCESSSCDNKVWSMDTSLLNADGTSLTPATITFTGGGTWDSSDPANRGNFIEGLKAQAAPSSEKDNVLTTHDAYTSDDTYENYSVAMNYLSINRYVNGNLQGFASANIDVKANTPDACDLVTGILGAAVGAVTGIGGAFFGIAGELTCDLAS